MIETARRPNQLLLANPRGFCAGVDRAIEIVDELLQLNGSPIYVRKEIVHNREVVEGFRARGVVFVDEIEEIPDGSLAVFSAHGVSPEVRQQAADRHLRVVDATCPLVSKVHLEALRFEKQGLFIILVGHANHDEVEGTLGQVQGMALVESVEQARTIAVPDPDHVGVITQTTLSLDDAGEIIGVLKERFPNLKQPSRSDICYATQNRQQAVKQLAESAEVVVVVGSENSSNSQRLRECAEQAGAASHLVDDPDQVLPEWFTGAKTVGVTAGASSPETLVQRIVERIQAITGNVPVTESGEREPAIVFAPPRELATMQREAGGSK
jgi:4-hydroxy-3-methylbut-2-enyl diphosphate reductase